MLTRCPHCQTAFRVTPDQIRARQGRVRCGRCQTVFDAIEALEEDGAPIAPIAPTAARESRPEIQSPPAIIEAPIPASESPTPAEDLAVEALPADDAPPPAAPEDETAADDTASEDTGETGLEPLLHEEEIPRGRAWPWVLGSLVALVVLGLQALVQLRVELAVVYPGLKPTLLTVCQVFGCDVPLPRKIDLIGIETSDLHPDPATPGRLQLAATLRNRAPFAQPYPHLEITLTDAADQAQVRRVFAPSEYLPADAAPAFAGKGDQAVNLVLEAPEVAAVGYRLYVFYP